MNRSTLSLGFLLSLGSACSRRPPPLDTNTDSDTDSDTDTDADSDTDTDTDADTDADTDTPFTCDVAGDCQACLSCVDANALCAEDVDACALSGSCTSILACATACAGDAACVDACVQSQPEGAVAFILMNTCQACDQCANACATEAVACPEAPGVPQIVVSGTGGLLLQGTLVTPTGTYAGEVLVEDDLLTCVAPSCSAEAGAATATRVVTHGIVMPGMIDAHNHVQYSIFDEDDWTPTRAYDNHDEWPEDPLYGDLVDAKQYLNGEGDSPVDLSCEMNKYGELKALIAGTTSVQGSANPANKTCFRTLARTIDQTANGLCGTDPPQSCPDVSSHRGRFAHGPRAGDLGTMSPFSTASRQFSGVSS